MKAVYLKAHHQFELRDVALREIGPGEALVRDCIKKAGEIGFGVLQFNAVVATNKPARHLYEKIGFIGLGTIKNGFRLKDGSYEDICPYYIEV